MSSLVATLYLGPRTGLKFNKETVVMGNPTFCCAGQFIGESVCMCVCTRRERQTDMKTKKDKEEQREKRDRRRKIARDKKKVT